MHMSEAKGKRQRAIAELIRANALSSQEELAERLSAMGYAVTQATISRDLEQLGAIKLRRGGHLSYALPDHPEPAVAASRLSLVFREWVRAVDIAGNLVVVKTPPGSAHVVGVALDGSAWPEIVGTICGDDTIFIACRTAAEAEVLAARFGAASVDLH